MQSNFTNYDDFGKYVEKQDQSIYDIRWSLPENKISAYRFEQFDKYAAEKKVEHIVMFSYEGLTNSVDVVYYHGNQSRQIWSGYVDSHNEYQVMMPAAKKFIEEYKKNSGVL
jgi:hypothetical protein